MYVLNGRLLHEKLADVLVSQQNSETLSASIEQQRGMLQYMNSLNDWLSRDIRARQDDLQNVARHVDSLNARLGALGM